MPLRARVAGCSWASTCRGTATCRASIYVKRTRLVAAQRCCISVIMERLKTRAVHRAHWGVLPQPLAGSSRWRVAAAVAWCTAGCLLPCVMKCQASQARLLHLCHAFGPSMRRHGAWVCWDVLLPCVQLQWRLRPLNMCAQPAPHCSSSCWPW